MCRGCQPPQHPSRSGRTARLAPATLLLRTTSMTCGSVSSLNSDNLRDKMQQDKSLTRRVLLAGGTALAASAAEDKSASGKLKVAIFSKHLLFLKGDALPAGAAEIGFDGIDLAVRKGGHVEPERVREDLPKLVAAIRRHGMEVPMLTTDIADIETPYAEDILKSMSELGIHHYRW